MKPIVDRIINERDNDVAGKSITNNNHEDFSPQSPQKTIFYIQIFYIKVQYT